MKLEGKETKETKEYNIRLNSEFGCIEFSLILLLYLGRKSQLPAESNGSITWDNK